MYKCEWFEIRELVPHGIWKSADEEWKLRIMFDDRLLRVIDKLRETYGKMVINDWHWKGDRTMSGFRPWDSTVGSHFSQHKFGRAVDLHPGEGVEHIRQDIMEKAEPFMEEIKGLEMEISWLHIDVRNAEDLVTFSP